MPTYEYACTSCGEHVEVVQSFRDDPLTTCPACGGALRKVFGSIGVVFKGSGFYKNDSRSAAKESTTAKESKDSKATTSSETSGSSKDASGSSKEKTSTSDGSSGSSSGDKSSPSKNGSPAGRSDKSTGKKDSSAAAS
jgi:putative FmdB family regulatory protein